MKIIIILLVVLLFLIVFFILKGISNFNKVIKMIDKENTLICGKQGSGKDLLMSNYAYYSELSDSYICKLDYVIPKKRYIHIDYKKLDIKNDYTNFLSGNINYYKYVYQEYAPILLPDIELDFPAAFEGQLKKNNIGLVNFMPLARHFGTHIVANSQYPSQVWDKLRNQCSLYIRCVRSIYIKGLVFEQIRIYEKYQSFEDNIPPYRYTKPVISKDVSKVQVDTHKISYLASYGVIKSYYLIYRSRSKYNSRYYKEVLENGRKQ